MKAVVCMHCDRTASGYYSPILHMPSSLSEHCLEASIQNPGFNGKELHCVHSSCSEVKIIKETPSPKLDLPSYANITFFSATGHICKFHGRNRCAKNQLYRWYVARTICCVTFVSRAKQTKHAYRNYDLRARLRSMLNRMAQQ